MKPLKFGVREAYNKLTNSVVFIDNLFSVNLILISVKRCVYL